MPAYDWRAGWGQLWQESRLDRCAVSTVGAAGVAQFMPGTWQDMRAQAVVPVGASPRDARWAIKAQAYYMMQLVSIYKADRPLSDKLRLGFASYNWGAGNVIKAQKKCNSGLLYEPVVPCLPKETAEYSPSINNHVESRWGDNLWESKSKDESNNKESIEDACALSD